MGAASFRKVLLVPSAQRRKSGKNFNDKSQSKRQQALRQGFKQQPSTPTRFSVRREFLGRGSSLGLSLIKLHCHLANPRFKFPHKMWFGSPLTSSPFPFLKPGFCSVKRGNKLQPKAVRCWYLGPTPNYRRDAMRNLCKSGRVVATRHVTWAHIHTHVPCTPQQAILAPR